VTIDRAVVPVTMIGGTISVGTGGLRPGRHQLSVQVSDYQESRNMENATAILPNTGRLSTSIVVR
jgi:hypothetical protein